MKRLMVWGAFIGLWQLLATLFASPVFPNPWAVCQSLIDGLKEGVLLNAMVSSLLRVGVGYLLAAVIGLGLGVFLSLNSRFGHPIQGALELLRPIPPIAWVPLAILWLGIGNQAAWFIVFVGAFFPIFIQVYMAFLRPPEQLMELAVQYRLTKTDIFWSIRLPAAAPDIFQALRVGLGLAWTSVIAAELVGVRSGLGDRIGQLRFALDYEGVIACMLCIGALGWLMTFLALKLEQRLCPWVHYSLET